MKKYIIISILILSFCSCATREEIVYFQNIDKLDTMEAIEQFEPRIEINDVLRIQVSSINEEVVRPFNLTNNRQSGGSGGSGDAMLNGYLVGVSGNINFPILGEIPVLNKSRSELEEFLTDRLREYVTDAVVRVRIMNFKVTVLGETGSSVVQVEDGRISVPQVIAMTGDISYNGKRENILIIRNHNGKLSYGRVDLTDADVFQNPYYYLKQNDIVYVEPTYRQVKAAGFFSSPGSILSLISSTLSLIFIFTR